MSENKARKALMTAINAGYQIDQKAFAFFKTLPETSDLEEIIRKAIEKAEAMPVKPSLLSQEILEKVVKELFPEKEVVEPSIQELTGKEVFHPYAKEVAGEVEVLEDPTQTLSSDGSEKGFLQCFRDRFEKMEKILRRRLDARDAVQISRALAAKPNTPVKIIGMVTDKREQKRRILMKIEDLEAAATVLVLPTVDTHIFEKAQKILLDQVICICATKSKNNLLFVTDFIWPDIPERKPTTTNVPVHVVLTSDLHIGSHAFLHEAFERFILWLNGKVGSTKDRELAGKVKYVVIAGDLVDGIGIYPQQEKELVISNIFEQYRATAKYIERIPDYIEVIIIPGNHDATRQALPQPAIPKKYAEPIYSARKVTMLGDPARVQLHGVDLLLYHGRSLEDVIGSVPRLTFQNPEKAMELLLKTRHVAPVYGGRTPIAPEPYDRLIISEPPDIFHAGHIHVNGYENYRGTSIVNSGAWLAITDYQRKMGVTPTPGRVPIVNLQNLQTIQVNFMAPELSVSVVQG